MNVFFAWVFGFIFSGYLLRAYCPEPSTLPAAIREQHTLALAGQGPMPSVYAHANYLWYAYSIIGVASFLALLVYIWVTKRIDARTGAAKAP
jgi:hypothetical protein